MILVIVNPVSSEVALSFSIRSGLSLKLTCCLCRLAVLRAMRCMYTQIHKTRKKEFTHVCTWPHAAPVNIDQNARKIPFNMRMDSVLRARLYAAAEATGISVTQIVESCLEQYLETAVVSRAQQSHEAAMRLMDNAPTQYGVVPPPPGSQANRVAAPVAWQGTGPAQKVITSETLPNVEPDARDRVRDGALRAKRLARGKKS